MKNNFTSSKKPKIGFVALLLFFCVLWGNGAMGQTRYLTADNANWSDAVGAWKLADLVTDTTIPAVIANTTDHNRIQSNVLTSTVDGTYYQRLITTATDAAVGNMKFAGTGRLFLDTFSNNFYTFGGTVISHQTITTPTRLTLDCDVEINNSSTVTTPQDNRNSVIRVSGIAGNVIEFSSLSDLFLNGNGPTVSWPQSGTVEFNGKISGSRGLTFAPGTTIFGATSDNTNFNIAANTMSIVGGATVIVNTAASGTFFKNTSAATARINMSGAIGTNSRLTINNANVWNSPLSVNTASVDRENGANLTVNADQTVGTARTLAFASATSVLNLTVASGVSINFAASNGLTWTAGSYLNIFGFDGATAITFGTTSGGLTATQLSQIIIRDGVNAGKPVTLDSSGKLILNTAVTNTWLGLSNVYNATTNWSLGVVPTNLHNVVIPDTAIDPIMASNGNAFSLTVDAGATLTINGLFFMNVVGKIYNSGTINVFSTGNLLQVSNIPNANTGVYNVYRRSLALNRLDYTMWSSPVSGTQTLGAFSPATSTNRFYTYNPTTNLYNSVASTNTFSSATGYLIRMPNTNVLAGYDAGSATLNYLGIFSGIANNGVYALTGLTPDTFYAVGNPYPSSMNTTTFLNGNATGGTLYFWRKTNAVANLPGVSSTGTAYAVYTIAGGTASGTVAPNNVAPTSLIFPGQGFIVKTGLTATSLTFSNNMRSGNTTLPPVFFKTKQESTPDRVWLNLTNASGVFSQALVAYMDGATLGEDNGIDGEYINDSPIALTSNINGEEFTIQGRPAFDASDVVALNFKTDAAGDYTIALDHYDGVFATGQDVYLVDSKTGVETDLKAGSYNFTAAAGVDNARFTLKYQKTLKVDAPAFNDNSISVYADNGSLFVNSKSTAISNVTVYDVQGRIIAQKGNVKSTTAVINNLRANNQVLIVKIEGEDNSVVTKKLLN